MSSRHRAWPIGLWFSKPVAYSRSGAHRRCLMLNMIFKGPLQLGIAQAVVAALAAIMVALLARSRNIHLESDLALALLRGAVQIVAVGSILGILLRSPRWT